MASKLLRLGKLQKDLKLNSLKKKELKKLRDEVTILNVRISTILKWVIDPYNDITDRLAMLRSYNDITDKLKILRSVLVEFPDFPQAKKALRLASKLVFLSQMHAAGFTIEELQNLKYNPWAAYASWGLYHVTPGSNIGFSISQKMVTDTKEENNN